MTNTLVSIAAKPHHYESVLGLNEQAVPHVNSISAAELQALAEQAFYFSVAMNGDQVIGFLLTLATGAQYNSPNYQWFSRRYSNFIYVDRIVVAPDCAGMGVGKQLYHDLEDASSGVAPMIACEVNLQPPNPNSLAFHQKQGFQEVGQQETESGQKVVCLMTKPLGAQ